jgi:NAD(P)-dependent dehydrogenase (short-subunit alcohol dehydrogenase family)
VIGAAGELTCTFCAALAAEGYRVRQVIPGHGVCRPRADCCEADLASPAVVRELHQILGGPEGNRVGGVLNCLGLCPPLGGPAREEEATVDVAEHTFNLTREFAEDLRSSAREGGGWFINLTGLGGQFGLGEEAGSLAGAGTLGISKTLKREHPELRVLNLDFDPDLPADVLSARLVQELQHAEDDSLEVGVTRQGRWRPALKKAPAPRNLPPLAVDAGAVVLITGGAHGVTADVARGLANRVKPRLVLVGRSPLPEPESPRTAGLDPAALRQSLLAEARGRGEPVRPVEIERTVHGILKDRAILANLAACRAAGATVEYHALDVRDAVRFGRLIDDLYERFGRIDGVVHGAGVIDDRPIADKTLASFRNVFRTKVDGAWTLARKLRPEGLKFVVFFGSVSGRFGNPGQVDYSAANEVLNKLAGDLRRRWPARVVCINWGPWDGGMVSDGLRQIFALRNIGLIPAGAGTEAFLNEIRLGGPGAEVVVSCSVERMLTEARNRAARSGANGE